MRMCSFNCFESAFNTEFWIAFELGIHVISELFHYFAFSFLFLFDSFGIDDFSIALCSFLGLFNQRQID